VQGSWFSSFFPSGSTAREPDLTSGAPRRSRARLFKKLSQIGFFVSVDGCCCARQTELLLERANGRYFSLYF
jgi:hypothetical protein